MATNTLQCWKCGKPLEDIPLPLSRLAKCKSCHADLHVCRICEFYDKTVSKQCREPVAEEVKEKARANFCGYLQPKPPGAFTRKDNTKQQAAKSELDALFGLDPGSTNSGSPTEADEAKKKLEDLFKKE